MILFETHEQKKYIFFSDPSFLRAELLQSLSHLRLFVTPWTAAPQASVSFPVSQSLIKFMSIELGDVI